MTHMLRAGKIGWFSKTYEITEDGQVVARFERKGRGGRITTDGVEYTLSHRSMGRNATVTAPDGRVVAEATGIGKRHWSLLADGVEYQFEKSSLMSWDVVLKSGDQSVGGVSRESGLRGTATAELPGLHTLLQVFVVSAVLAAWDVRSTVIAGGGGAAAASG